MAKSLRLGNKAKTYVKALKKRVVNTSMNNKLFLMFMFVFMGLTSVSCHQGYEHKTVVCIPVYGQSYALGEEAIRITDFDSLARYANGRIVTERLDHDFGYFDNDDLKEWAKKMIHYQKRSFELSIYKMAQYLADNTGNDTLICIFPGGQGATAIANLNKGTTPYQKFMEDIATAYEEATLRGWDFRIPAICWMQGESDIADYPDTDYRHQLTRLWEDLNHDIWQMTQQQDTVRFICYQANLLTRAERFRAGNYLCPETTVPQAFVSLLLHDNRFWASGPTYPYPCVGNRIHIDATGQQAIGVQAARSALGIIRGGKRFQGLIPTTVSTTATDVIVHLNVPAPPLVFDTIQVRMAKHYGFSVISKENCDIATSIRIEGDSIRIGCSAPVAGCKVRYAVNGDYMKSGNLYGPRGNLRDSGGNWCYQFDLPIE